MTSTSEKIDMVYLELRDLRQQNSKDHERLFKKLDAIQIETNANTAFRKAEIRNKAQFLTIITIIVSAVSAFVAGIISWLKG